MPAKFVIHTVGPVWSGGNSGEPAKLANCYNNSLRLAVENGLQSVAFPNISTGIYGYPKKEAAAIAVKTVSDFLRANAPVKVYFVCFDEESFQLYESLMN